MKEKTKVIIREWKENISIVSLKKQKWAHLLIITF